MALKVDDIETGEITEPRLVVRDDGAQTGGVGRETRKVVVARRRVNGHPRLPIPKIGGAVFVEIVDEPRR
jgi:hypothetical protein